jgi:hypothetical protein
MSHEYDSPGPFLTVQQNPKLAKHRYRRLSWLIKNLEINRLSSCWVRSFGRKSRTLKKTYFFEIGQVLVDSEAFTKAEGLKNIPSII